MRKTTKADLAKKLEAVVEETQQLPNVIEPSAYIIDGMALLQSLNDSAFQMFNDLGKCVWKKITTLMGKEVNSCVVIVFDRYDHQHSVNNSVLCECLPACHALTGCDTTSSLYRIGKATALTRLKTHLCELLEITKFGLSGSLEEVLPVARRYALLLYGQKKKVDGHPCTNLDKLRYTLASTTDLSAANLPPTEDAFQQHVLRALYQTAVWRHSHLAKPLLWNPVGRGWRLREDG